MEYKTVPAPKGITIDKNGSYDSAVRSFGDVINKEAQGGWELHSITELTVTKLPGFCASCCCNKAPDTAHFNMFIFKKG
jgi:hypothetical protein